MSGLDDNACNISYPSQAKSYVNAVRNSINNRGNDSRFDQDASGIKPTITLSQETPHDFPLALLGCYKDFCSIANIRTMCSAKGFLDVDFKYLEGLWVLFVFTSKDVRDKFLNHNGVMSWFSTLKPWHDDFVVEEHLIWLEIEGVPIRAWNNDIFTQICGKWGEVLFMDDSDQSSSIGVYEKQEDHLFEENDVEFVVELKDDIGIGEEVHDLETNAKVDVPTDVPDEVDEFWDLVVNTWNNDHIVNANDHQGRLSSIDIKIDQGNATEEDFKDRRDSLTFLETLDRMEARDLA
ncbi:RNA-directed DNA polymerase, eukaryota, reverse transcriptase zinc-binding domain protein [Tanacetum coccineum]